MKTMFSSSLPPVVCRRALCLINLRYLCFFVHSDVQHILCCVFVLLVYPILPVSLDCPFLIILAVFCKVYFMTIIVEYTTTISKLFWVIIYGTWFVKREKKYTADITQSTHHVSTEMHYSFTYTLYMHCTPLQF
jgi:hypothetical protein